MTTNSRGFAETLVKLPHRTLADFLDDAVVPEGATDEVLHCQGFQRSYGIAIRGSLRDEQLAFVEFKCTRSAPLRGWY
jgi:hypothetical protein